MTNTISFLSMYSILLSFFLVLSTFQCREQTLIIIKPDGIQRGLISDITNKFEKKGFKLIGMKFIWARKDLLEKHYEELSDKPFFPTLIKYMSSGPVIPMVWEGNNVVKSSRAMIGATNPVNSPPGTIRGDYAMDAGRNLIHGSDGVESARREIELWFKEDELVDWERDNEKWNYEDL